MSYTEFDHMRALRWTKKILVQRELGEKCVECGIKDFRVLEFHHENKDKEHNVSRILSHRTCDVMKEAKKCILLCRNCHMLKHSVGNNLREKYKNNMMNYKGKNCCENCGLCISFALDFHHVDPSLKIFKLSSASYSERSRKDIKKKVESELDKCIVLCRNCHILEHVNEGLNEILDLVYYKINNHSSNSSPMSKNRDCDINTEGSAYRLELSKLLVAWRKNDKNIKKTSNEIGMNATTISDNLNKSKVYRKYRKRMSKQSSKYKGVSWIKGRNKWLSSAKLNGKTKNLGRYDTEEEARRAYLRFIKEKVT